MNIDNFTVAELRQIAKLAAALDAPKAAAAVPNAGCSSLVPVVVCTAKHAVVFGYTTDPQADPMTLTNARMALYWSADVGGVFGLADIGPTAGCKISATATSISLNEITAVLAATPAAVKAWTAAKVQGR